MTHTDMQLDVMARAYLVCALWADTPEDEAERGGVEWNTDTLAPETKQRARDECAAFLWRAMPYLGSWTMEQVGHDFWLTRNHHGAGFWDRELERGDVLTKWAHAFGEVNLYAGDNGLLYID